MSKKILTRVAHIIFNRPVQICFVGILLSILPALSAKGTTLTANQVAQAAFNTGFNRGSLVNAIAIAGAESQFVLEAHCNDCIEGYTENSCGLWQINIDVHTEYDELQLLSSASYNAMAAHDIFNAASGWTPWSTFNNGVFINYLQTARIAAQGIDSTVIQAKNDRVACQFNYVHVRPTAGDVSYIREVNNGATGTVLEGPIVATVGTGTYRYIWWKIRWDDGLGDGWSAEDYISRTGTSSEICPSADLTGDCLVDFSDFAVMASQWLNNGNNVTPPSDMNMILIPGGTFLMGDGYSEGEAIELPLHLVTLDSFYIGKYDITNGQYCDFLNAIHLSSLKIVSGTVYSNTDTTNSYPYCRVYWNTTNADSQIEYSHAVFSVRTKGGRNMSNDPVVCVSWYGAAVYCNWRSQQEGKEQCYNNFLTWECDFSKNGYHLPTEAQWEYAARGGLEGYRFPWGDTIDHNQANYYSMANYIYDVSSTRGYHPTWSSDGIQPYISSVGSFAANGYGLCDVAGNVSQWCNDWFGSYSYSPSPQINPTGPESGFPRILRGGTWGNSAVSCRAASRYSDGPGGTGGIAYGFRISQNLH